MLWVTLQLSAERRRFYEFMCGLHVRVRCALCLLRACYGEKMCIFGGGEGEALVVGDPRVARDV